jgi:hypothetical protein
MQYTANGDGYTYVPDSTYPTLILNQPTLGLSRTYVPPTQTPVVIESRPQGAYTSQYSTPSSQPQVASTSNSYGMIKLSLPKAATGTLTYSLNGHLYTIQPGYAQTFRDDRAWTIEFKPNDNTSDVARIPIKTGTYTFGMGPNGWELQQPGAISSTNAPPSPLPSLSPTLLPEYGGPSPTSTPALSPTPTPLPPP